MRAEATSGWTPGRLVRRSALYAAGNALPRLGAFLLLPVYTRVIEPAGLGVVSLMISLGALVAIIFRLGQEPALLRLHFDFDAHARGTLYGSVLVLTAAVGVAVSLGIAIVFHDAFPRVFPGTPFVPYGVLALGIGLGNAVQFIPAAWMRAEEKAGAFVAFATGTFAVVAASTLFFTVVLRLDAVGALLGQLAGASVVAATAVLVVGRVGRLRLDRRAAMASLGFGLPLLPHAISVWMLSVSDRWLIGLLYAGTSQAAQAAVGVYWIGYQVATVVSLIATSMQAAWTPTLFRHGMSDPGVRLFSGVATFASLAFVAVAAVVGVFASELVAVIATAAYLPAGADVLRVAAMGSAFYAIYMMTVGVLMLTRRTRRLAAITTGCAMLNVAANVIMIPRLGIVGAAWGSVIGYGAYATLTYAYARSIYPGRLDLPRLVSAVMLGGIAIAGAGVIDGATSGLSQTALHGALAAGVVCAIGFLAIPSYRTAAAAGRDLSERPTS